MSDSLVSLELIRLELLEQFDPEGRLAAYFDILRVENQKVNLVSRETIDTGLETLAAESLLPFQQIQQAEFDSYLDIGSGGGFPAIPLVLTGKVRQTALVERTIKKSLALDRIIKALDLDNDRCVAHQTDFEQLATDSACDLITMRLVRLTPKILRKVKKILRPGGFFVYYSAPPKDISKDGFSIVTYCYKNSKDSPGKYFTIFQKN